MTGADRVIRWSTADAVVGVAAVAAVESYEHAYALVRLRGEAGWTARLIPLAVDGLIYASSMVVMLDSARRKMPVPALARWLLGVGIAATLAANIAQGLGHGLAGAAAADAVVESGSCWAPYQLEHRRLVQAGMAASTRAAAMVRAAVSALGSRSIQALIPAPS